MRVRKKHSVEVRLPVRLAFQVVLERCLVGRQSLSKKARLPACRAERLAVYIASWAVVSRRVVEDQLAIGLVPIFIVFFFFRVVVIVPVFIFVVVPVLVLFLVFAFFFFVVDFFPVFFVFKPFFFV